MKFSPTVEEIADISPICSTIVAIAIGIIPIIAVIIKLESGFENIENTVSCIAKGSPTQAASLTAVKST